MYQVKPLSLEKMKSSLRVQNLNEAFCVLLSLNTLGKSIAIYMILPTHPRLWENISVSRVLWPWFRNQSGRMKTEFNPPLHRFKKDLQLHPTHGGVPG